MRYIIASVFIMLSSSSFSASVITCGDVMSVGVEAKAFLHEAAQKRAQEAAEDFVEKEIKKPYVNFFGEKATPEDMSGLIEIYWCESLSYPLHSAYYSFYMHNKSVYK